MKNTKAIGNIGEQIAVEYLERQGYTVKERNAVYVGNEVDIICEAYLNADGDPIKMGKLVRFLKPNGVERTIIFVEVKSRSDDRFGAGIEAVTPYKAGRYIKAASLYQKRYGLRDVAFRFDVIEVTDGEVRHTKSAFDSSDAKYPKR